MKRLSIFFLLTICFSIIYANTEADTSAQGLMVMGNESYQKENYSLAIDYYQQIIDYGYESAALYYNLGNSYYKNGNNAQALLWYERAQRLAPGDEDIHHNIVYVNQKITDKIDPIPQSIIVRWWNNLAKKCNEKQWSILSIICCGILVASIIVFLFSKRKGLRIGGFNLLWCSAIVLVFSIIFASKEKKSMEAQNEAIVMDLVVEAKNEPNVTGKTLFVIHEGLKVEITSEMNGWIEIKIPNGEKGWIMENMVEVI